MSKTKILQLAVVMVYLLGGVMLWLTKGLTAALTFWTIGAGFVVYIMLFYVLLTWPLDDNWGRNE